VYKTTDESFRFHNKKFDEMRCKLESTENPRSFEKNTQPHLKDVVKIGLYPERPWTLFFYKTCVVKRPTVPILSEKKSK